MAHQEFDGVSVQGRGIEFNRFCARERVLHYENFVKISFIRKQFMIVSRDHEIL